MKYFMVLDFEHFQGTSCIFNKQAEIFFVHFQDTNADKQVDWFRCNIIMRVNNPTTEKRFLRVGKQKENTFIWSVVKESDVT